MSKIIGITTVTPYSVAKLNSESAWEVVVYDTKPQWKYHRDAYVGEEIPVNVSLSSKKKYIAKIEVKAEASDIVYLHFTDNIFKEMTYTDGCYECEFDGIDFSGDTYFAWESESGYISATKATVYAVTSMGNILGNIDSALDRIIAIQDSLIGGEG
jgi:hypothetical protein